MVHVRSDDKEPTEEELSILNGHDVWILNDKRRHATTTICRVGQQEQKLDDLLNLNVYIPRSEELRNCLADQPGVDIRSYFIAVPDLKDPQNKKFVQEVLEREADRLFKEEKRIFGIIDNEADASLVLKNYTLSALDVSFRNFPAICMHVLEGSQSSRTTRTDVIEMANHLLMGAPNLVYALDDCASFLMRDPVKLENLKCLVIQIRNNMDYLSLSRAQGPPPIFLNVLQNRRNSSTLCIVEICPAVTFENRDTNEILLNLSVVVSHRREQKLICRATQCANTWPSSSATTAGDHGLLVQTVENALQLTGAAKEEKKNA